MTLTVIQTAKLERCEEIIERGKATFFQVAAALAQIKRERLYKGTHTTFKAYCEERWGFSKSHAYRLIQAGDLSPIGDSLATESQARELLRVPQEKRAKVLQIATANGKLTAESIRGPWNFRPR